MLNEEVVKAGYVNVMTIPPNAKYQDRFLKAYREAKEERGDCGENEKIYSLELIDYDSHHWGSSSYIF